MGGGGQSAGDVITGRLVLTGEPVRMMLSGNVIAAIEPSREPADLWIAPGLIDLQVNGYAGHDLNCAPLQSRTVARLAGALRAVGVTTFLPTLITAGEAEIKTALAAIAAARAADPAIARAIPHVHVEGPHISPADGPRGAHPRQHVRPPDIAEFDRWQRASGDLVGMVTLSPHWAQAPDYIRALGSRGIHVAIGHTDASPEAIRAAVDAGARLSTHLGNGIAAVLPRHPNAIWTQLADDRLTKTFIADGHHLPDDTLTAMLRAAGKQAVLVSDTAALGGCAPGRYSQPVGGEVELAPDGRLSVAGTPFLAGAALPLVHGVAHAAAVAGLDLAEAIKLATVNPGRFAGGRGRLAVGEPAEFILFRWQRPGDPLDLVKVIAPALRNPDA